MTTTIYAADLFAGAGGTSTALTQACESLGYRLRLTAVNHWDKAVESHAANHPEAEHHCETLDGVDPRKMIPGRLDVLCASPECTHHSNARGGKPCSDQSRSTAWHVIRWAEALRPKVILVENVREFAGWGPLSEKGRPLKRRSGEIFAAWMTALRSIGYTVEHRILNAADFGAATSRTRLFVMAVRGKHAVPWPDHTHARNPVPGFFTTPKPWRAAREVIDWTLPSVPLHERKRPLKENTLRRIAEGIRRFWRMDPEPFLLAMSHSQSDSNYTWSVNRPMPTITSADDHALVTPFVIGQQSGAVARAVAQPLPTVAGAGAISLIEPFLVPHHVEEPGRTPRVHSIGLPLPTIVAGHGSTMSLVEPFLIPTNNGERPGQAPRTHSVGRPLPTLVGSASHGVVSPFLVTYYSNGRPRSIEEPLDTISTHDRFGLVSPPPQVLAGVQFRMLQPHELAAGMGFPAGYRFCGNRGDQVRQIGNAVEVNKAREHLLALLRMFAA